MIFYAVIRNLFAKSEVFFVDGDAILLDFELPQIGLYCGATAPKFEADFSGCFLLLEVFCLEKNFFAVGRKLAYLNSINKISPGRRKVAFCQRGPTI